MYVRHTEGLLSLNQPLRSTLKNSCQSKLSIRKPALITILLAQTLTAQAGEFVPDLKQHDKPHPYYIFPVYDLIDAGGEMPYVQEKMEQPLGAIESVVGAMRSTRVGTSYNSATKGRESFADFRIKMPEFFMRTIAVAENAGDYETPDGTEQRFGYDRDTLQFVAGATPHPKRNMKLVFVKDSVEDHKTPLPVPKAYNAGALKVIEGFGQDPIKTDRQVIKAMWDEKLGSGALKNIHVEAFRIELDRIANNFDLRTTPTAQQNQAVVDRTNTGFKLDSDLVLDGIDFNLSMDYTAIRHNAQRYGGPMVPGGLNTISAYQYPGVELDEWELKGKSIFNMTEEHDLTVGLSWKYVEANATKAELSAMVPGAGNPTSLALYQTYHGSDVDLTQSEGNWSAKAQWDFKPKESNLNSYVSLGHFYRSPDTQERYFAAQSFNTMQASPMGTSVRAVGNPNLDWELHRRLEVGMTTNNNSWIAYGRKRGKDVAWQFEAKAYYDDVKDFISRDRAHGQTVTGINDNARIWRNVNAELMGLELDLQANLTKCLATRVNLNLIEGKNTLDNRDLYGIAPMELNWFLDYFGYLNTGGTWNVGAQIRHVAKHDDVDADATTGSGYDAGETDAFTVLNLYGAVQWKDRFGIRFGLNNVTDAEYQEADANFPMEGIAYLVTAPGRHVYVAFTANF
jgi:iron complex outermembrane receptor protein